MATRKTASKSAPKSRGGWEYRVAKPVERTGIGEAEWGEQCAAELSKLGADGWEVCGQVGSGHLLLKRAK
jgi:hypothetical protein